jgi:antitoxin HicB
MRNGGPCSDRNRASASLEPISGHFRPEPEGGFTVICPNLPAVVTYGETLKEAQANACEAIELCLEVMREDGEPIPSPDRDMSSPIDQLVPVATAGG